MPTIESYVLCPHCKLPMKIIHSDTKEITNLLLCIHCERNVFEKGKIIELDIDDLYHSEFYDKESGWLS